MKKLIKEHLFLSITLVFLNILSIILLTVHVEYDITTPGYVDSIEQVITIEGASTLSGSINTVSVYSYSRTSLLNYLIGKINPFAEINETYKYYDSSNDAVMTSGTIQKNISFYNAIIAGYSAAGFEIDYEFKGHIIHTLATYAPKEFQLGDIIIAIDGEELSPTYSYLDFIAQSPKYEQEYSFKVIRKVNSRNEEIDLTIIPQAWSEVGKEKIAAFGLATYEYCLPYKGDPAFSISSASSIGPSGGLMQSLYVYEQLTGNKLTHNLKIAGTGTVDAYGNAGAIGGIYQKIITASYANVDIFFVPVSSSNPEVYQLEDNYKDALASYQNLSKKRRSKMTFVPVSSLTDIIDFLQSRSN